MFWGTVATMGRSPSEQPEPFALAIATEIRKELGNRRMSGRALGRLIDRSESYIRKRIAGELEFSLNDIERLCSAIDVTPEEFIGRIDKAIESVASHSVDNITEFKDAKEEQEWIARKRAVANTDPADDTLEEDRD